MNVQLATERSRAAGGIAAGDRSRFIGHRLVGIALAVLVIAPLWRLLAGRATGLAGSATMALAAVNAQVMWWGFALVGGVALLVSRFLDAARFDAMVGRAAVAIARPPTWSWSLGTALAGGIAAAAFGRFALENQPNLIDAMSQLLHARFIAAGQWTGPGPDLGAFWTMQQSLFTPRGWASQYPPGHILALAAGLRSGMVWLVGPLALAVGAALMVPVAERLLPGARATARMGALLVAVSPFVLAHAGAFSSHTTAMALGVAAVWCALHSGRRVVAWSVAAGFLLGAMLATRPLSAAALGLAIVLFLPLEQRPAGWRLSRVAWLALGAAPMLAGLALYNHALFGSALRFGYEAALGPAAGLGFGVDPWGNTYGPVQALAYVSAELGALSLNLLETPLPLVAVIGVWLVLERRLTAGERFLLAWALIPLTAHLAYWHHGLFMGPRMMNEMAPAWCLLATRAAVGLTERAPGPAGAAPLSPRVFAGTLFLAPLLAGVVWLGPERLWSYRQRPQAPAAARAAAGPAVVFVHGGWTSRLAMQLAAGGMRLDSVETALRQNPTCAVEAYVGALRAGTPPPPLDFARRATALPSIELSPGNRIRVADATPLSGTCALEARADRMGAIDVSPLVWRGDLPLAGGQGTLFVRDLGPDDNARLLARFPDRTAYVLMMTGRDPAPRLMPYGEAMTLLWGNA
ncbi:MAG: hypothetical protein PVH00_03665 [Gemmatimonadota bacterium]